MAASLGSSAWWNGNILLTIPFTNGDYGRSIESLCTRTSFTVYIGTMVICKLWVHWHLDMVM